MPEQEFPKLSAHWLLLPELLRNRPDVKNDETFYF
jgi:hypothetical protein